MIEIKYLNPFTGKEIKHFDVIDAMSYSRMYPHKKVLTNGMCIMLHQEINGLGKASEQTWKRLSEVVSIIKATRWEKPLMAYTETKEYKPII